MAAVAAFKSELAAMQRLLTQQRDILAAEDLSRLLALQGSSFTTRAGRLTDLKIEDVSELTTLIQQGPFPTSQQHAIIMTLATSLHDPKSSAKEKRCQQELWHFQNYPIEAEKNVLCDPALSMTIKVEKGLDVLERIGAVLLKETCKKHVLSAICAAHQVARQGRATNGTHLMQGMEMQETGVAYQPTLWSAQDLRSWLLYFKGQYTTRFKNKRADAAIGHIDKYPEHPSAIMYGSAKVTPLPITAESLGSIADNVWCRRHAQALRGTDVQALRGTDVQLCNTQNQNQSNPMAPMTQMMQVMMTAMQGIAMQSQGMAGTHNSNEIELRRPAPGQGIRRRAIEDQPAEQSVPQHDVRASPPAEQRPELPPANGENTVRTAPASSMSPQEQADKLIKALTDGDVDDDDDDTTAAGATPTADKAKGKGKAKAKPKAKTKAKAAAKKNSKTAVKKAVAKGDHIFSPRYELEASRDQYLFRPGLPVSVGGESTKCFKFDIHGGKKGAEKAAKEWFKKFKTTHSCQ